MKNIFIIFILLLCINVNAQEKSKPLLVSLEKDSVVELGVELVFENTTSDTLMLLTKFENFLGITKSNSGFMMVFHKDHKDFSTIVDELPDNQRHYVFNNGRVLISPHCKVKFKIDLNIFLNGIKSVGEYGVDFYVNAFYRKLNVVDFDIKSFFLEKTNYLVLKKINYSSGVHENPEKSTTNPQPYVAVKLGKQEGEIPFGSMDLNVQDEAQATVTFANDASSLYALDSWQDYYSSVGIISGGNGDPNSNFDGCKYEKISANYWVKWKYIPPGKTDKVTAELLISDKAKIDPTKVVFKTKAGKVFESSYNATTHNFTITLLGGDDKDGQELYAMHPATESGKYWNLGKLDMMSYAPVERKMVLVKTSANDNTDATTVQTELNRIYNPVGISWSVSSEQFTYNTDNIFEGKSGILSTYLPNMRTLNAAFMAAKADKLETKTAYLFLVNQTAGGDRDKQGFMPRGMQFGYINTSTANVGGVIAHELGHGAFKLYHTFNSGYGSTAVATQGTTENLMDYKGGINLAKWQWDQMYDPAIINGVFDGDKEAEISKVETKRVCIDNAINLAITKPKYVLGANNKYFILPNGASIKSIVYADLSPNAAKVGAVVSFALNGNEYTTIYETSSGKFLRYAKSKSDLETPINKYEITVTDYASISVDPQKCTVTVDGKDYPLTKELCNCAGNQDYQTQPAKDFISEYTSEKDKDYYTSATAVAQAIDLMGDLYEEYNSIVASQLTASSVSKNKTSLDNFQKNLLNYYKLHKDAAIVNNPNCPECPKHPINGDAYWDKAGRNWVFVDNKWKDLSGEFCDGDGCNNDWKSQYDVSKTHKLFYDAKLEILQNDGWYRSLTTDDALFQKNLWRATQFATVRYLKEKWIAEQKGDSWWNILFGNAKDAFYTTKVANGDMTFYADATLDGIFTAADIFLIESLAKNVIWKAGIKGLIIDGGAKQLSQKVYYTACKKSIAYRLSYNLSAGTPEATAFFEKQLAKTLEVYDYGTLRYIKFDPATGEKLTGSIAESGNVIRFEGFQETTLKAGLTDAEQANALTEKVAQLDSWITKRANFWNDWITKCFPDKNWNNTNFVTKGENYNTFKITSSSIFNDMKALNSNEIKLQEIVEAGSTPTKIPINHGDEFFKIVVNGNNIEGTSVYYIDQEQLNLIKINPETLEQVLGLPLGSVSAEYDVFKITYQGNSGYVFKSIVAGTEQSAIATPTLKYITSGGGTQTLILDNMDRARWLKTSAPIERITPNKLPQIGN